MEVLGRVKNGNYWVTMFSDGTKIRSNDLDYFEPEKPESLDLKITNSCTDGPHCAFCHENSQPHGEHGDIMNLKFIETLLPFTELAIGGGNPLEHPDLIPFLKKCKKLKVICNMTVNQIHFMKNLDLIHQLVDEHLIWGLGVSLVAITDSFLNEFKKFKNGVLHLINGVHKVEDIQKLYDKDLKILILGYKHFRRGEQFYNDDVAFEMEKTYVHLPKIIEHFKVVSFDNLALDQLKVKDMLKSEEWDEFYMGADGTHTLYVDSVRKTFSTSSTTPVDERQPLLDDIKPMFDYVRGHHG